MKKTKTEQVFEMNRDTVVAIKSKKTSADLYTHKVVLTHTIVSRSPLAPSTQDEVAELIGNIDLEDEQTELLPGGGKA